MYKRQGYDFNEIEWKEKNKTIEVKLPEAKVLSNELDMDSFKVYHEEESIFSKITLEENNDAVKKMKLNAQENAIANGDVYKRQSLKSVESDAQL